MFLVGWHRQRRLIGTRTKQLTDAVVAEVLLRAARVEQFVPLVKLVKNEHLRADGGVSGAGLCGYADPSVAHQTPIDAPNALKGYLSVSEAYLVVKEQVLEERNNAIGVDIDVAELGLALTARTRLSVLLKKVRRLRGLEVWVMISRIRVGF